MNVASAHRLTLRSLNLLSLNSANWDTTQLGGLQPEKDEGSAPPWGPTQGFAPAVRHVVGPQIAPARGDYLLGLDDGCRALPGSPAW